MILFSRLSIKPSSEEYPFRAPECVENEAKDLFQKLSKYCIHEEMMLLLLPVESEDYKKVKTFISKYPQYFDSFLELYERKYSKSEIEKAEYFVLRVENLVYISSIDDVYEYCCKNRCFVVNQKTNFRIETKSMKNKDIGFTTNYRFVVSERMKNIIEENEITNVKFIPVYQTKKDIIVAYQIEPDELMPELSNINNWNVYLNCDISGEKVYDPNNMNQFTVRKELVNRLHDFNATKEIFTELGAHNYIISRKMFDLIKRQNIKSLKCEPIKII